MTSTPPLAALIEIGGSHAECLYSQILFLRQGGREPVLFLSEDLRDLTRSYPSDLKIYFFDWNRNRRLDTWRTLWKIRQQIIQNGIREVILNTAQSGLAANFCTLPFPKSLRMAGTLHDLGKLQGSGTQRRIHRRIRHYFVLNDYLLKHPAVSQNPRLHFQSYYPIYFPPSSMSIPKPPHETWIAVPGKLEYRRRDYGLLIETLAGMPHEKTKNLRFFLLGQGDHPYGDRRDFLYQAERRGLQSLFITWGDRVSEAELHASIQACDWVMPLTSGKSSTGADYLHRQISGAFNLAFGFQKPLIMHQDFAIHEDFQGRSRFYEAPALGSVLESLGAKDPLVPYQEEKWSLEFQANHYCRFLDRMARDE